MTDANRRTRRSAVAAGDLRDVAAIHGEPPAPTALPCLFSLKQVSEALSISVSHLRREVRLRRIEVVRLGRNLRISRDAVAAYVAGRQRRVR